jgi:DnaK suppressor protein
MDEDQARARLTAERAEVEQTLHEAAAEAATWQDDEAGAEINDAADSAQTLTAEDMADAVTTRFRHRIAAIDRALQRLDNGTYGYSVRSGVPIPAERLDADPAAELTIEEARTRG